MLRAIGIALFFDLVLVALGCLILAGCAEVPSTRQVIAAQLGTCLDWRRELPLSLRCECWQDAEAWCDRAGLGARCWYGWDRDQDGWTIAACRSRRKD